MIELFFSAMALGFFFNAAPGAIFTESLRRGLKEDLNLHFMYNSDR
jgi:hypothetical protein